MAISIREHQRYLAIKGCSTTELIQVMIVRAVVCHGTVAINSEDNAVYDNEFIWAQEELDTRIKKLEEQSHPRDLIQDLIGAIQRKDPEVITAIRSVLE